MHIAQKDKIRAHCSEKTKVFASLTIGAERDAQNHDPFSRLSAPDGTIDYYGFDPESFGPYL